MIPLLRDRPPWAQYGPIALLTLLLLLSLSRLSAWRPSFPHKGLSLSSGPQFHIVISYYDYDALKIAMWTSSIRSVPFIQDLGVKVFLYNKNEDISSERDLGLLKAHASADEVIPLPNVGREGGSYLHHLIAHHDSPPLFTLFTQDEPQHQTSQDGPHGILDQWYMDALYDKLTPQTGFLSLIDMEDRCTCDQCGGHGAFPLLPQIYTLVRGEFCHGTQIPSLWGQFIVSGKRIRQVPISTLQYLRDMVEADEASWIHNETEPSGVLNYFDEGHRSKPSNPLFGHTLERAWSTVFNCSDPEIAVLCEGPGGCVCLDEEEGAE